jgi:hypothetical protein
MAENGREWQKMRRNGAKKQWVFTSKRHKSVKKGRGIEGRDRLVKIASDCL